MKSVTLAGLGLLVLTVSGCKATCDDEQFYKNDSDRESGMCQFKSYLADCGKDFMDILTVGAGVGKAGPLLLHGNAHVTKYAELGAGSWSGYTAGMLGRGVGTWREEKNEGGFAFLFVQNYWASNERVPCCGTASLRDKYLDTQGYNIDLDNNYHWADIGFSLHVIAVGVDFNVSPFELVDAVFGLLGNYPNAAHMGGNHMPWDIGTDVADDDTRVSVYDDKIGRYRHSSYSLWPTIWPTTFGHHEEIEGGEWEHEPYHGPDTGSFGGAFGGDQEP